MPLRFFTVFPKLRDVRASLGLLLLTFLIGSCGGGGDPSAPRFLLLISVDTLRADRLGSYGSERNLTPNLDALAADCAVFERTYAPSSFTLPSVSTFLTGRYPTQNAISSNEHVLPRGVDTLATELSAHGYATGAVVSNWILRRGTGLDRDFHRYDDKMTSHEAIRRRYRERIARRTTDDALSCLEELLQTNSPVFLWVHYQDPHGPYTPPEEHLSSTLEQEQTQEDSHRLTFGENNRGLNEIPAYQRLGDHDDPAYYRAAYHGEIRYADAEIGRLLQEIRNQGLYEDAVIVFVADHGEGLGEDGYWFAHGEYLSDPLVRVPLFVRRPGTNPTRRSDVASLVDLMPTLLPLCGIAPQPGLPGRDLFGASAESQDSPVFLATLDASTIPRVGFVKNGYKYIATENPETLSWVGEARRIESPEASVQSQTDLERFHNELEDLIQRFQPEYEESVRNRDAIDRQTLRALGYLDEDE